MLIRIWGGHRDGQLINIDEGVHTLKIPETSRNMWDWLEDPEPSPMPTLNVVTYKIMNTTRGRVAVHPSIDTGKLI